MPDSRRTGSRPILLRMLPAVILIAAIDSAFIASDAPQWVVYGALWASGWLLGGTFVLSMLKAEGRLLPYKR